MTLTLRENPPKTHAIQASFVVCVSIFGLGGCGRHVVRPVGANMRHWIAPRRLCGGIFIRDAEVAPKEVA